MIPVLDGEATIGHAVRSGLAQDYPGPLEIVIAHGPSTDATGAVLEELAVADERIQVIGNPSGKTPSGLNRAVAASTGEVIVRCDAQAQLPPGYVRRAVEILTDTGAGNVGGVQAAEGTAPLQRAVAAAQTSRLGVGDARYRTGGTAGPVDTVYLGVFPRSVLEEVGGYDETLLRNQDYELNFRIRAGGREVYFHPDLRVAYRPRSTLPGLWRQYFDYGRWKRIMLRRHIGSLRWRQLVPPLFVLSLLLSIGLAFTPWPWSALVVPGAYLAAIGTATVAQWAASRDAAALLLPLVYPTMHLAWGLGFLLGRNPRA